MPETSAAAKSPKQAEDTPKQEHSEDIVADDAQGTSEFCSLYDESNLTDTTSLSSSILAHKYEHGRRYHGYREGSYWAPNDERQNDQLDLFHHIYNLVLDGDLHRAPIGSNPQRILDLGTGTGIWAIDMADQYPSAEIIGTELSPIQPSWVPPNCKFEIDDFNLDWTFPTNYFDFVHSRNLYGSVDDWPGLYRKGFEVLRPGGWYESIETSVEMWSDDDTLPKPSYMAQWCALLQEASMKRGKDFNMYAKTPAWMKEAGFVNTRVENYKMCIGPWAKDRKFKEVGLYNRENLLQGVEGFTLVLFTRVLEWGVDETQALIEKVKAEITDPKVHGYYRMCLVIGQKPEEGAA